VLIWCAKKVVRTYGTVLNDNIGARESAVCGGRARTSREETHGHARGREEGVGAMVPSSRSATERPAAAFSSVIRNVPLLARVSQKVRGVNLAIGQ